MSVPHPSESSMRGVARTQSPMPRTASQAQFRGMPMTASEAYARSMSPPRTASDFPNFDLSNRMAATRAQANMPYTSADFEAQIMRRNPYTNSQMPYTSRSFDPMTSPRSFDQPRTASPYGPRTASPYDQPRSFDQPRTASPYDPRIVNPYASPRTASHLTGPRTASPMTRSQFPQPVFSAYR